MSAQVIGISGSPVPNSNTDRAVKAVLEATGLPHEFIKLSELSIEPCRACLGCLTTNQCVLNDAAVIVADKLRWSRAFVIGGYTPYSSLDSRTKIFMERMFCMRHRIGLNRGKIGAAVITTAFDPNRGNLRPAAEIASRQIDLWMQEEGMTSVGTLVLLGNVPCIRCGYGDLCELSGVHMLDGPQGTVASVGTHEFEDVAALGERARELGRKIHQAVTEMAGKPC